MISYLRSAEGTEALAAAAALEVSSNSLLRDLGRLRRIMSPAQAAAVLEQTALRRRASAKFSRAAQMLFTAEALQQASGETIARHSAMRYQGAERVADYCCGIGGDTIALARQARVEACDHDAVRLACAEHNVAVYGLSDRVTFRLADVESVQPEGLDAIFFDPGRRARGRRIFTVDAYQPPVSIVERWLPRVPAVGIKVAPGVAHEEIRWQCEQEFVADGSDLKECLLWFGPLATAERRATILPDGVTLTAGAAPQQPAPCEPGGWLYDPSPAVTRAGLIWELAGLLGAQQLDPALAYLCAEQFIQTPFARAFQIEEWMPFNLKRLKARLRTLDVGRVVVRRRGSPVDPELLERRLRQEGREERALFLTRVAGRSVAIICHEHHG